MHTSKKIFFLCISLFLASVKLVAVGADHAENLKQVIDDIPEESWPEKVPLEFSYANVDGVFGIKYKPESFFARNVNLLNANVDSDKIYYSRHTVDANLGLSYGRACYGVDVTNFFITLRQKVVWGNPNTSARTNDQDIRILDAIAGSHRHDISYQFPRIREVWFSFNLNEVLRLHFKNKHYFTLGAFPFRLGRGIALGDAFAVNPGVLGFYSENTVDQYAYGFKFSGHLSKTVGYDIYGAILENFSDSFRRTSQKIRGNTFGHKLQQERGFGSVDYVVAGRLRWAPFNEPCKRVYLEPYWLFNSAPEQRVEFRTDATAKLGTIGFAGEFVQGDFEWGFDMAQNLGYQSVYGLDRNIIQLENRDGVATFVNSRVHDGSPTGPKTIHDPKGTLGKDAQTLINESAESASQNGKEIGVVTDGMTSTTLFNDNNRFRDPYSNSFKGWMLVVDAAYNFRDGDIRWAVESGLASGDENPNKDLTQPNDSNVDSVYDGFIGLQEIYSGKRIRSTFLLGGAANIPRPLTTPTNPTVLDTQPSTVSSFTNLVYVGTSCLFQPQSWDRYFAFMPNLIWYWQQKATKKFDIETNMSLPNQFARKYLGFEANVFMDVELMPDFKLFFVGSVLFPGAHYRDIKGKPLTSAQKRILDRADKTGIDKDILPLLGDDTAYTLNLGLEVRY